MHELSVVKIMNIINKAIKYKDIEKANYFSVIMLVELYLKDFIFLVR